MVLAAFGVVLLLEGEVDFVELVFEGLVLVVQVLAYFVELLVLLPTSLAKYLKSSSCVS